MEADMVQASEDLQLLLNSWEQYCNTHHIETQTSKTKLQCQSKQYGQVVDDRGVSNLETFAALRVQGGGQGTGESWKIQVMSIHVNRK